MSKIIKETVIAFLLAIIALALLFHYSEPKQMTKYTHKVIIVYTDRTTNYAQELEKALDDGYQIIDISSTRNATIYVTRISEVKNPD